MSETIERLTTEYQNLSDRFAKKHTDYNKQYYRIYLLRLEQMTTYLLESIQKKWQDKYPICKLYKLSEESYDKCIVIGTLFKDQKLKPSVLKQLGEANLGVPQPIAKHRTDESDVLHIEDELQRYRLEGGFDPKLLVTGITCALLGCDIGGGKFAIEDYVFPGFRAQIERPIPKGNAYVIFMSGLDFVNIQKYMASLQVFIQWISGYLEDFFNISIQDVTRVVIAGNSIQKSDENRPRKFTMTTRTSESADTIDAVKTFDQFLNSLCQVIDVDVMPGENDPSNHILPQKSLHHCLFPNAIAYKTLNCVTNPYECDIGGTRLLGTSGQPVTNVLQYSDIIEPIDVLENCLIWSHIAPTSPDTLGCYPHYDCDPFVIEECPHVLFAGNQEKFDTKIVEGDDGQKVRLICVPEFSTTGTICVLNLKNLDCFPIEVCC